MSESRDLSRFAWLAIATAIVTITLKAGAWALTGSVGLLSDAAESVVNLVAAVVALVALKVAARPANPRYPFGRTKAEYLSAAVEGTMIFVAAGVICVTAVERFINPRPLENVGIGLLVSVVASVINGVVGMILIRAGRRHRSITLTADGKHLMTDVVTSAGVLIGVGLVWLTGWDRLDPIVAFAVGVNIIITGTRLITESMSGLLDAALPKAESEALIEVLRRRSSDEVAFHGLQTRVAGHQRFASVHVLVPGVWTVQRGHDFAEEIENELRATIPDLTVTTHLEPIEDPASWADIPVGEVPLEP
ncbi:cation-efflux pump [Enemella evansiae]|uniref:cation diffusion facilitator family transporter n=1 Tax=Enemella evansiae TaxID=2016499 RepID=UPI000B964EB5|nr:cation diffusion facilitator family transporter [Enemella evansiae]OYN97651.1 cation-efflux pump [Enemella evansiae]